MSSGISHNQHQFCFSLLYIVHHSSNFSISSATLLTSFHIVRHTNATLLLYQGANITTVQKLLGHRNIETTQIYSEVMDSTVVRDLERNVR